MRGERPEHEREVYDEGSTEDASDFRHLATPSAMLPG
jgi:hypothetical protein